MARPGAAHGAQDGQRGFVAEAFHELRSPLATIRTLVETSPVPGRDDELLLGEVARMQRLVEDLLTLAQADAGGLMLTREEVDLDDLVHAEARRLRAIGVAPVTSSIQATRVIGDAGRLAQVLRNLADNAAQHTSGGVQLQVRQERGEAILTVDDDADPVPPGLREAVFGRFARLPGARAARPAGTGLGLAVVRELVARHGGTVTAGVSDQGSCRFEVRLPAAGQGVQDGGNASGSASPGSCR